MMLGFLEGFRAQSQFIADLNPVIAIIEFEDKGNFYRRSVTLAFTSCTRFHFRHPDHGLVFINPIGSEIHLDVVHPKSNFFDSFHWKEHAFVVC